MAKIDIINNLIKHFGYKSYLEIGVQHKVTFNKVLCEIKVGIDPDRTMRANFVMTSDQFFAQNKDMFDIILIDGNPLEDITRIEREHVDFVMKDGIVYKNNL